MASYMSTKAREVSPFFSFASKIFDLKKIEKERKERRRQRKKEIRYLHTRLQAARKR